MQWPEGEGYSAPVKLELHVGGEILGVSKVGPDRIVLQDERVVSGGKARLVITIGKKTRRRPIVIDASRSCGREVSYW